MVLKRDKVEVAGALRLPLGGVNGYVGVRGNSSQASMTRNGGRR